MSVSGKKPRLTRVPPDEFQLAAFHAHAAAMWRAHPAYDRATNTIPQHEVERAKDRIHDESMKLVLAGIPAVAGPRPCVVSMWDNVKPTPKKAPESAAQEI